jgi:hypothetical protein
MENQFLKFNKIIKNNPLEIKSSDVQVISEKEISGGDFGNIFLVKVKIGNSNKENEMILKKFKTATISKTIEEKTTTRIDTAEDRATRAFEHYNLAKKAGLKVFSTYRINEDKKSILMTNGDIGNWVCIGQNERSPSLASKGLEKINKIENYKELTENVYAQAIKATENNLYLHSDCFMFLIKKNNPQFIDFVIGDLDNLVEKPKAEKRKLFEDNLMTSFNALNRFLIDNIKEENVRYYRDLINETETQFLDNTKIS